jgi:hypothetical protein
MTQRNTKVEIISLLSHGKDKAMDMHAIGSSNGDWDELKDKFCLALFPMSCIVSLPRIIPLPRIILDFERHKKESIGAAWARFSVLIHVSPDLSLSDSILL